MAFDGCFGAEVFGLVDLLNVANEVARAVQPLAPPPFRATVVSVAGKQIELAGGALVRPERASRRADLLVVPGFAFADPSKISVERWEPEVDFLRTLRDHSMELAALCVGAFLLAEAGLLHGRQVTTAWLLAPELARRYPLVDVQSGPMVVRDGRVLTSGAFSACQDLAIRLVERNAGEYVARSTSNITLVPQTRQSQNAFVDDGMLPVPHAGFADDVQQWLRAHLADQYNLPELARHFNVSTRTLLRRFSADTGRSPLGFLQSARVSTAKRLLETSRLSIGEIAAEVGYRDATTFRQLFVRSAGLTPSEYRRQFGGRNLRESRSDASTSVEWH